MAKSIDKRDLEHILEHTSPLWEEIRGNNLFISGGTGFFGCWLLESFIFACDRLNLGTTAFVLSRDPQAFALKAPHLAKHPAVSLLQGDVRTFKFPVGNFPFIIHAANNASARMSGESPLLMFGTIVDGTRHILEFARTHNTRKLLLASSGAVYGKQPPGMTHIHEDYAGAPDTMDQNSAYGEGKRVAEMICGLYSQQYGLEAKIARCFAFTGPYLPLDAHYAAGNFIRDVCRGGPVRVQGDGSAYRSYLYAADLAIWLWTILVKGESCRPYNVGSGRSVSIAELASLVSRVSGGKIDVIISGKSDPAGQPQRYVPSTGRADCELSLREWIPLEEALRRHYDFVS